MSSHPTPTPTPILSSHTNPCNLLALPLTEPAAVPPLHLVQGVNGSSLTGAPSTTFSLDTATPLEAQGFPNPPRSPGHGPATTIPNVAHLLGSYGVVVRYNVIKKKLTITAPGHSGSQENFDASAITQVSSLATLNGMTLGQIPAILEAIGDRERFNPVADWIQVRPWDGADRLRAIYMTLCVREGFPIELKETILRKWLLSTVAAAVFPNFRSRGVLTLQGPQNIGKTAWTQRLVSDPLLRQQVVKVDHHMDAHNKDSLVSAITHWIVELGELDGSFKRDIAKLKGFLTADQDKVRRPYGKIDSEYPRMTVFCASVNDENFLVDPTGNTRFWTIPVVSIDYLHTVDMQQLFAQLLIEIQNGAQWWLTQEEDELLELQNRKHRAVSALRERVLEVIDTDAVDAMRSGRVFTPPPAAMTCIDFLAKVGIESATNAQCQECGAILRELLGDPKKIRGLMKWRIPIRPPEDLGNHRGQELSHARDLQAQINADDNNDF